MSVSSNSRKESTESNAAQQMHSTMGIHPDLAQLNDTNMVNDLPSRVASDSDTDVPGDVAEATSLADDDMSDEAIDESKRASWGQPPVTEANDETLADAESGTAWDGTNEGAIPATRSNEPDRTLGNS